VRVEVSRPKVEPQARGVLVIQDDSTRLTSRLLAAFATPDAVDSETTIRGTVIPTGYAEGRYSALVQVSAPGSSVPRAAWDFGISLVARDKVRQDTAGRVSVERAGVPVVFETQMDFAPGPYELIAVAHERTTDAVANVRLEGSWPDPEQAPVTFGPLAVLQPASGAFLRGSEVRLSGSRALSAEESGRTDRPTAVIGIVCRDRGHKGTMRLERRLVGDADSAAPFATLRPDLRDERCAVFSDLIPAGVMSAGAFTYEIRAYDRDAELGTTTHSFSVTGPDVAAMTGAGTAR
jgi:hypothetical protein